MSELINTNYTAFFTLQSKPDDEWQRIIDKLLFVFGIHSSGSKSADKAKLHELELEKAEREGGISSSGFLTLSKSELEKIRKKQKEKQAQKQAISPSDFNNAAQIQGAQIYLAIKMNSKSNFNNKLKKNNNKYLS